AEHAGCTLAVAAPRKDLEGRRVGLGDHVRLVYAGEALDRRAVEADALRKRILKLGGRDGDRLEDAQHVREPQTDEADVALLDAAKHILLLLVHGPYPALRMLPLCCMKQGARRVG